MKKITGILLGLALFCSCAIQQPTMRKKIFNFDFNK